MKLFRTICSIADPKQPLIRWDGDVRGIIVALRAREAAIGELSIRLRSVRPSILRATVKAKPAIALEVAA